MLWHQLPNLPHTLQAGAPTRACTLSGAAVLANDRALAAYDFEAERWQLANDAEPLHLMGAARRVFAWSEIGGRGRVVRWNPGLAYETCAPGPTRAPQSWVWIDARAVLFVAAQAQPGVGHACELFDTTSATWRPAPPLPLPAQRWRLDALAGGSVLAHAPERGAAFMLDSQRQRWRALILDANVRADAECVLAPWGTGLLRVGRRELHYTDIREGDALETGAARTLMPLPRRCKGARLRFVGDLALLLSAEQIHALPALAMRRYFEDVARAAPTWRPFPRPRTHVRRLAELDVREPLRFVTTPSAVLALEPPYCVWLAALGHGLPSPEQAPPPLLGDPQAWPVFADWLLARGDRRRGEALQLALHAREAHGDPFRGSGRTRAAPRMPDTLADDVLDSWDVDEVEIRLTREHGFVTRAWLNTDGVGLGQGDEPPSPIALLGEAPSACFVHHLHLDAQHPWHSSSLEHYLHELAEVPRLPRVRTLLLGPAEVPADFLQPPDRLASWLGVMDARQPLLRVGPLAALQRLASTLHELQITGTELAWTELRLPHLEHLRLRTPRLSAASLEALASSELPALRSLELWIGARTPLAAALFDAPGSPLHGPALRSLAVHAGGELEGWLEALVEHPLLARLTRLDLSSNQLGRKASRLLVAKRELLSRLHTLELGANRFGPIARRELDEAFGTKLRWTGE